MEAGKRGFAQKHADGLCVDACTCEDFDAVCVLVQGSQQGGALNGAAFAA